MSEIRQHADKLLEEWSKNYVHEWGDAVMYTRYSPGSKQHDQSIEIQINYIKKYADQQHLNVVGIYIDQHLTGTNYKRPDFRRMLADAQRASWSYVLCYDIERFGRNKDEIVENRLAFKRLNKIVLSATQLNSYNLDGTRNLSGILNEGLHEAMAEYYSVELSIKVKHGQEANIEKGLFLGGVVPYGYYSKEVSRTARRVEKKLEVDPKEAEVIKKIFKLYLDGYTIQELQVYLSNNFLRNKQNRLFSKNQLINILQNEKYIGNYIVNGKRYENYQPAIIDKEIFEKVQERFKRNKANSGSGKASVPYLLTTKLFCGECAGRMLGESGTSKNGKLYHYYKCYNKKRGTECEMPQVAKDLIENLVIEKTVEHVFAKDKLAALAHEVYLANTNLVKENAELNNLQEQLKRNKAALDNIMKGIEQGIFTKTTKSRLLELESAQEKIIAEIKQKNKALEQELSEDMILAYLQNLANMDLSKFENKLKVIDMFISRVYLYKDKIVIIYTFDDYGGNLEIDKESINGYIADFEQKSHTCSYGSQMAEKMGFEPMRPLTDLLP